jgi:hypothetical protein
MFDKEKEANKLNRTLANIAKRIETNETAALKHLLSTGEGRDFLWYLLRIGKVGMQPFTGDRARTDFCCGELNVGQQILARIIETEPAGYYQMLKDQEDATRERNFAYADSSNADDPDTSGDGD